MHAHILIPHAVGSEKRRRGRARILHQLKRRRAPKEAAFSPSLDASGGCVNVVSLVRSVPVLATLTSLKLAPARSILIASAPLTNFSAAKIN